MNYLKITLLSCSIALVGCASYPNYYIQDSTITTQQQAYQTGGYGYGGGNWWGGYGGGWGGYSAYNDCYIPGWTPNPPQTVVITPQPYFCP